MTTDPQGWGDPLYDYHFLEVGHYYKKYWMLIVDYGVHEPAHKVHIQNLRPVPGTPLADAAGSP